MKESTGLFRGILGSNPHRNPKRPESFFWLRHWTKDS